MYSLLLLLFHAFSGQALSKPGNESILETKTLETTLYATETYREPNGKLSLSLVWIPGDIESNCLERPLRECQERDHCLSYPTGQKCSPDLSSCRPVVLGPCERYGITVENAKTIRRTPPPSRVLIGTLFDRPAAVAKLFEQWRIPLESGGKTMIERLSKQRSIRAKVKWERWTNGENFSILDLL